MIDRLKQFLDRLLERALIVLMGIMVLNVLWQVATRFILSSPSAYTDELARYGLIWVALVGSAYAAGQRMHLAIDYFTRNFSGRTKMVSELFIQLNIMLFALFVLVIGGVRLVSITLTLGQVSAALQINLGYVYMVVPVSGLLIVIYAGIAAWETLRAQPGAGLAATAGDPGGDGEETQVLD